MEIDNDLAAKMRRLRDRESDLAKEKAETRHFAQQELHQLESKITTSRAELNALISAKSEIERFMGIQKLATKSERMGHGAIKELCFEALRVTGSPMSSNDIKIWLSKNHPDVKSVSVPATLSRQVEYGNLTKDQRGKYSLLKN